MCLHCDFCVVVLEYVLDKIVCETTEPVTVGKMHDSYAAFKDLLKKRQQPFAPEVETRRTISEHDGGGMFGFETLDLGFKVLKLFPGRHPGIDGLNASTICLGRFNCVFACMSLNGFPFTLLMIGNEVADCVAVKHPMPPSATSDIGQSSSSRPSEESTAFDSNDSLSLGRFDIKSSMDFCIVLLGKRQQSSSHIGVAQG